MGTNYFLRTKACEKCGRSDPSKHIGKSSIGWQFHFRGYRDEDITSFKKWVELLSDPNSEIYDEYDGKKEVEEFIKMIKDSLNDRINHYNVCCGHPETKIEREYIADNNGICYKELERVTWKDEDGFAFSDIEFG